MDLDSSTNTFTIDERYRVSERDEPGVAKNNVLSGKLRVDAYNKRTGWIIEFGYLTCAEYDDLKQVYLDQFDNNEFLSFTEDNLSLTNEQVYLNMPTETELQFTKHHVRGVTIILEPEDPDILDGVS